MISAAAIEVAAAVLKLAAPFLARLLEGKCPHCEAVILEPADAPDIASEFKAARHQAYARGARVDRASIDAALRAGADELERRRGA